MATSYLAMTDEDFLKQEAPADVVEAPTIVETPTTTTQTEVVAPVVEEPKTEETKVEAPVVETVETTTTTTPVVEDKTAPADTTVVVDTADKKAPETQVDGTKKEGDQTQVEPKDAAPNYEAFYKQVMAPFKANGKMIDVRSPAEAIQLMQMGANYTAKMQALVPHRKLLLMLENNGLMDEGKLSYLIDLDKKNPEAIKKLVKDAGVDPMEIDTNVEPAYREGNHRVTDEEAAFRTTLDDMKSNPAGLATLQAINTDWDQASKELLWKSPEVLTIIHGQKESGIYDRIVTEMNRQRTFGQIAPGVPFLQSYKTVGDQLVQANAFADLTAPSTTANAQPVVVATTVATTKSPVTNNEQANAASQTRTAPKAAQTVINPLAMSDDDFLKQMKNRV